MGSRLAWSRLAVVTGLLPAIVLSSCAPDGSGWAGRVGVADGVLRVENPREPLASEGEIGHAPLWIRTGPDLGAVWEVPSRVRVFRGTIYLADRRASRVHRVTTGGTLLPSFGEPGSGPGQYRRIIDAVPTDAGLFVIDAGNARVEILSDAGEIRASFPLHHVPFAAAPLGRDGIALFEVRESGTGWTSLDATGATAPFEFPDFDTPANSAGPVSGGSTRGDRLVRLRYVSPEIRIYSREGVLERVISIPLPAEEATDEEVERVVREVGAVLARDGLPREAIQRQVDAIRARPRTKLRFRKVVFDDASGLAAIWEQNPEDLGSGDATLHVLTDDGVYLAALNFDRAWTDFDLADGVIYVLARDPETDVASLEARRLSVSDRLRDRARAVGHAGLRTPPARSAG